MAKRWTCVEAGCDWAVVAADEETIILLAQRHIEDAHGSFELEEMIEAVLEEVSDASHPRDATDETGRPSVGADDGPGEPA